MLVPGLVFGVWKYFITGFRQRIRESRASGVSSNLPIYPAMVPCRGTLLLNPVKGFGRDLRKD